MRHQKATRPGCRRLKINHGTEVPQNLLFFDTETTSETVIGASHKHKVLRFRFGFAKACRIEGNRITRIKELLFDDIESFWRFVESRQSVRSPLTVYAHNIHFDLNQTMFFDQMETGRFLTGEVSPGPGEKRVRGSRPWNGMACIRRSPYFYKTMGIKGKVNFVDTYNYFPMSLERIGESFGFAKGKMPDFGDDIKNWHEYCKQDVEILFRVMTETLLAWKRLDCGVWQVTSASLAMHSFLHGTGKEVTGIESPGILIKENPEHADFERLGYYGGYTGAFFIGKVISKEQAARDRYEPSADRPEPIRIGPVYRVDVNSLYPFVMMNKKYPINRLDVYDEIFVHDLERLARAHGILAVVRLRTPEIPFPVSHKQRLVYSLGEFVTVLCGDELTEALEKRRIVHVYRAITYAVADIFTPFVKFWSGERIKAKKEGNVARSVLCKMIMNSLYGKFGQKPGRWVDRPGVVPAVPEGYGEWVDATTGKPVLFRAYSGNSQEWVDDYRSEYEFPAISAFVTANARHYMRKLIKVAGERNVLHQSTDSLLLLEPGMIALNEAGLIDPHEIGKLKHELTASECEIWGGNWYKCAGKFTRTGFWGRAKETPDGKHVAEVWETCETQLQRKPDGSHWITEIELQHQNPQPKGIVDPDGSVRPWYLDPERQDLREVLDRWVDDLGLIG